MVWVRDPGDSTRTAEARREDSGEACDKHGTQRQAKALVVRHVIMESVQGGAEAVLMSTRFKLVTGSMDIDVSDRHESAISNLRKWRKVWDCQELKKYMAVYSVVFSTHGKI